LNIGYGCGVSRAVGEAEAEKHPVARKNEIQRAEKGEN
jgi:hypothetical protein